MIKRILAGAAAAGLALSLMNAGGATAATCNSASNPRTNASNDKIADTTGGGFVYGSGGATGGYLGAQGGNGWIEVGGSPTGGGYLRGHSTPEALNGYLQTNGTKHICVNGTAPA